MNESGCLTDSRSPSSEALSSRIAVIKHRHMIAATQSAWTTLNATTSTVSRSTSDVRRYPVTSSYRHDVSNSYPECPDVERRLGLSWSCDKSACVARRTSDCVTNCVRCVTVRGGSDPSPCHVVRTCHRPCRRTRQLAPAEYQQTHVIAPPTPERVSMTDMSGVRLTDNRRLRPTNREFKARLWIGLSTKSDVRGVVATAVRPACRYPTVNGERRCSHCWRLVSVNDDWLIAVNRLYHTCCLTCCVCKRTLQDKTFYFANEQTFCENDYLYVGFRMNTDTCATCRDVIVDKRLRALGRSYHPQCFRCTVCDVCLDGVPFTIDRNSKPHCIPDYISLYAPRCSSCHGPISPSQESNETTRIVAIDRNYHESCFRCMDCGISLVGHPNSQCFPINDRLLCRNCHVTRVNQSRSTITRVPPSYRCNDELIPSTSSSSSYKYSVDIDHFGCANSDNVTNSSRDVASPNDVISFCSSPFGDDDVVSCSSDSDVAYGRRDDVTDHMTSAGCSTPSSVSGDDVSSCIDSDVTESSPSSPQQQQQQQNCCARSVDSGLGGGISDDTMTSSDTETLDASGTASRDDSFEQQSDSEQVKCDSPLHAEDADCFTDSPAPSSTTVLDFITVYLNCSDLHRVTDL